METENTNTLGGENFKWIKLHIDETLMTTTVNIGNDALKWKYILLLFYYGKEETKLSYKKASLVIGEKALKKLIEYEDVLQVDEMIKIPQGDRNWETFTKTKEGNSKGGKATQENKRLKYADSLTLEQCKDASIVRKLSQSQIDFLRKKYGDDLTKSEDEDTEDDLPF